jgi:N-acetylmuramoyl-L-alanine amidase
MTGTSADEPVVPDRRHTPGRRGALLALPATIVLTVLPGMTAGPATAGPRSVRTAEAATVNGLADATGPAPRTVISSHLIVASSSGPAGGERLAATDGGVFALGDAAFYGSMGGTPLNRPVVGMAATPDGGGYWLVASDGGIFAFGDAGFYGSMGGSPLNRPVVGMATTIDGRGYWLVASDGGIFAFGDAGFYGSMGGSPLNQPVVGMSATPDGGGYWLVAADGGIFAFGDAGFQGSTGAISLASPMVGMSVDAATGGYRLVAADGGVFCFDAPFAGSAVGLVRRAVVALDTAGTGYRVVASDGGVYAFGGAPFLGAVSVPPLVGEVVTIDPGHNGGNGADPAFIDRPIDGGDFTEPCDTAGTTDLDGYPEHAFNFDVATRLATLLTAGGATVVLTRSTDTGVGPCVDVRAAIGNLAGSDAAISIHGDGGPTGGRGFAVDVPVPVVSPISDDRAIVGPSGQLGDDVRDDFQAATGEPVSDYAGTNGIVPRADLGGLNLSTVPKVLIECANMQNAADTANVESPQWRQQAAQGLADGITAFLVQRELP